MSIELTFGNGDLAEVAALVGAMVEGGMGGVGGAGGSRGGAKKDLKF